MIELINGLTEAPLKPMPGIGVVPHEVRMIAASDGQPLACRIWKAWTREADDSTEVRANPKAAVVYLHGIEGHSQWVQNTASLFSQHGISVYAPDRRGSGLNNLERGQVCNYKSLLADIEIILHRAHDESNGAPLFLIGNCWGGKPASLIAAANYTSQLGKAMPPLAGLILTCPALHTKVDFDLSTKLDIGISVLKGSEHALKKLAIPIEPSMFTKDAVYLEYIKSDRLRLLEATKQFFFEQFFLSIKAKSAASKIRRPTLLIESGRDEIVDVSALDAWFDKVAAADKTKHFFAEASHSIEFDPTWFEEYCRLMVDWMTARCSSSASKSLTMKLKSSETKTIDAQAAEIIATETNATETKGTETKGTETKGTETKAEETKAAETKGTETKAEETKPAETNATETSASGTRGDRTNVKAPNMMAQKRMLLVARHQW